MNIDKENGCYKNLQSQINAIFRDCREGSIKTRYRYKEAVERFSSFLATEYKLQKFENIKAKHIEGYVERLKNDGASPSTIKTDLSAIRYFYKHSGGKNRLPDNSRLDLERRSFAVVDRSWLPNEIAAAKAYAKEMGRMDIYYAINLASAFGLRLEETCKVCPSHLRECLQNGELYTKGKNGKERYIHVRNSEQLAVVREVLQYAKEQHLGANDKIICHQLRAGVQQEKRSIQAFINNHKSEFMDPGRLITNDTQKQRKMTLNFHGLRYSFTNQLYDSLYKETGDSHKAKLYVSYQLGHNRESVTKVYLQK